MARRQRGRRDARPPNYLKFLGVEAPTANDLNILPTQEIIDEWKLKNPDQTPPDPSRPKELPLHRKKVIASLRYEKLLKAVKKHAPHLYEKLANAYRWLFDPTLYESVLGNVPSNDRPRESNVRLQADDIEAWLQDGKIEEFQGEPRSFVNIFDVIELFKLRRRGICEPYINDFIFASMLAGIKLPTRAEVRKFLHKQPSATPLDAAAFYDQFPLAPEVQPFFVFNFNGKNFALKVLPMGFRPAADIAHLTAEAMLAITGQKHALAYIDNFLFTGPEQEADVKRFLKASQEYGLIINESSDYNWSPTLQMKSLEFIGEQYDLTLGKKCSTPKTITKITRAKEIVSSYHGLLSASTIAAVFGILIFASPSHDIPLSDMFPAMRYLSHLGRVTTDWSQPAPPIDSNTLNTTRNWIERIINNPQTDLFTELPREHEIEIQVDASSWGWGALIIHQSGAIKTLQNEWPADFNASSSSIAEPMAAWLAIASAVTKTTRSILLRTDHMNLVYAINRKHSLTASYNEFLRKVRNAFPELHIIVEHIAGINNVIADKLSRGLKIVNEKQQIVTGQKI